MPSGGDGFYYFSVYLSQRGDNFAYFEVQINGGTVCTALTDQHDLPGDAGQATCGAAAYITEGSKKNN